MENQKFTAEYEMRSSPKVLFPYISTASGLEQWFAEKVNILPDQRYDFQWDGDSHIARQTSIRLNKSVRFDFEDITRDLQGENYLEMRLDVSDLTQSTFFRIVDCSQNLDEGELVSLWAGFIDSLKEIVGS